MGSMGSMPSMAGSLWSSLLIGILQAAAEEGDPAPRLTQQDPKRRRENHGKSKGKIVILGILMEVTLW